MPGKSTQQVSFLSYNLYCLPWLATMLSPSSCPMPAERSSHFLSHIPNYDILALQEVWEPRYRIVEAHARDLNLHVVASSAPSAWNYLRLKFFGGGLVIISKHPIVQREELVFGDGSHSDGFVTKGVLYAKIHVGGASYIHVFNTHLQASYGYEFDRTNPYAPIRRNQLEKMAAFVKELTSEDHHPIVLMGDFNVNARKGPGDGSDSHEYVDMLGVLQSELYEVFDVLKHFNDGVHPVTFGGQGVRVGHKGVGGQRLDFLLELRKKKLESVKHVFTKGEVVRFEAKEKAFTHISDHFGATAMMEMHTIEEGEEGNIGVDVTDLRHASISLRS